MARDARTTASLKERLANSLIELLANKPFEEISISEISDLADVGRATYYRHFASKDDLLNFKFHTILKGDHDHSKTLSPETIQQVYEEHLNRLYANRKTFETVYSAGLDHLLFRYMYRSTTDIVAQSKPIDRYRVALHAAISFAIADQWITSGFEQSPEELSKMLISQVPPSHEGLWHKADGE